jgi:hypothetical protein
MTEQWETVPAGARSSQCRGEGCGKTVFWIERPRKGKLGTARVPVDCDVPGGVSPDSLTPGRGVNHFQTCVAAEDF